MTKVKLPESGLSKCFEESCVDAENVLKQALTIPLDVPYTFGSRASITSLPSKIEGYLKKSLEIKETFTQTDNNFNQVNEEINNNFSKFDIVKIPKRDQVI